MVYIGGVGNEEDADKIRDYLPIIIAVPSTLFLSCLLLLAPLAASTVSLCEFYFCRLIGKALGTGIPKEREEDKKARGLRE